MRPLRALIYRTVSDFCTIFARLWINTSKLRILILGVSKANPQVLRGVDHEYYSHRHDRYGQHRPYPY